MITFISINYNTKQLAYQAIDSIIKSFDKKDRYEIILVDNASTDGSKEFFTDLEKEIEKFKYIYNTKNYGFGKANNIGFQHANGEYIYILNTDTILHTKNIDEIIEKKFHQNPEIGVLATKVLYEDGSLQPNVQSFSTLSTITMRLIKIGQLVRSSNVLLSLFKFLPIKTKIVKSYLENFNQERGESFVDWASGCSLIFKREVYEKVNGFDENFFMYTEDEEICWRVHQQGYKILYTPDIVITHLEGKSNTNKKINEFLLKEKIKSEFYYYKKHFPEKLGKLKLIYKIISWCGYPFSERLRLINKSLKDIQI